MQIQELVEYLNALPSDWPIEKGRICFIVPITNTSGSVGLWLNFDADNPLSIEHLDDERR